MKFSVEFTTNDKKSIVRALDGRNNIAPMLSEFFTIIKNYR